MHVIIYGQKTTCIWVGLSLHVRLEGNNSQFNMELVGNACFRQISNYVYPHISREDRYRSVFHKRLPRYACPKNYQKQSGVTPCKK